MLSYCGYIIGLIRTHYIYIYISYLSCEDRDA